MPRRGRKAAGGRVTKKYEYDAPEASTPGPTEADNLPSGAPLKSIDPLGGSQTSKVSQPATKKSGKKKQKGWGKFKARMAGGGLASAGIAGKIRKHMKSRRDAFLGRGKFFTDYKKDD